MAVRRSLDGDAGLGSRSRPRVKEDMKGYGMAGNGKLKLGLYWAASCGGCDIAMVGLGEKLLARDVQRQNMP